jgi:hypothetical protein
MNGGYGRDYRDDDHTRVREDWEDRPERGRTQRDYERGEREHGSWGSGRSFDLRSGDRSWEGSGHGRSQSAQGARYGFFGKGPKDYTRSDERIREDVCDRLSDDDEVDASDITVTVKDGEVILEGSVPDRRSKHRAEDIAESVGGVRDVTNSLRRQKGLLQEMGDRMTGRADAEQHGHTGSGTRNSSSSGDSSDSSNRVPGSFIG